MTRTVTKPTKFVFMLKFNRWMVISSKQKHETLPGILIRDTGRMTKTGPFGIAAIFQRLSATRRRYGFGGATCRMSNPRKNTIAKVVMLHPTVPLINNNQTFRRIALTSFRFAR
jgi:hypothetical protein